MPLRLFRNRTRVGSYVVMLILGAAVFALLGMVRTGLIKRHQCPNTTIAQNLLN